jgi:anti-sigma regulatory factor (Ser/Thr protein kinase)
MATSLDISIDATSHAPVVARNVLGAAYADTLAAVTLHDLKVIVTELVTNSWRHGPGEPIRVLVEPASDCVRGSVEDGGHAAFGKGEIRHDGGIGLHMVDALADDWEIRQTGGAVRFSLGEPL